MSDLEVTKDEQGRLHLGPRVIPIPTSISAAAQRYLTEVQIIHQGAMPAFDDKEGWKAQINAVNARFEPRMLDRLAKLPVSVETRSLAGVTVYVVTPDTVRHPDRAHIRIHGGGWVYFGGKYAMAEAAEAANDFGCVTFGIDYRMPPEHPFPAAVDDCSAAYAEIIKEYAPGKIAISGESAGGNLSAATTLNVRDKDLPMPGAVLLMTPSVENTRIGDTRQTNNGIDAIMRSTGDFLTLYAPGHDRTHPLISPARADFSKGFPPTFLQSGTRDLLLSDTVIMHRALRRAGIWAELNVWEAMPHAGFGGHFGEEISPEDREVSEAMVEFVDRILDNGSR